jgi:hypothetical protein
VHHVCFSLAVRHPGSKQWRSCVAAVERSSRTRLGASPVLPNLRKLRQALVSPYESGFDRIFKQVELEEAGGESKQLWAIAHTLNVLFDDDMNIDDLPLDADRIHFERCLSAVNRISQASRLVTGETNSWPLSKNALDNHIMMFYDLDPNGEDFPTPERRDLHQRPINPAVVSNDDPNFAVSHKRIAESTGFVLMADDAQETFPFHVPNSLAQDALNLESRGLTASAIITLATSAEGLLRGIHRVIHVDLGYDAAAIQASDDTPFATVVRSELPKLLGGNWQQQPEAFMRDLYDVRNRIVHAGRPPTWMQVESAFEAYAQLKIFLDERIERNFKKYPRTFVAWNNHLTGLSTSLSSDQQRRFEEFMAEPMPFWLPGDIARR